jgi:N-acyl-phosphatidylethanolamine-hydrolysing phospholipase D
MPLLLAPLLIALALLLGACAGRRLGDAARLAAIARDGSSTATARVNKPLSELLRWWWSRRELDLDALVAERIAAAWRDMPVAWRSADTPWRLLPVSRAARRCRPRVVWFGHATLLVEVGGLRILADPHFSEQGLAGIFAGRSPAPAPGTRGGAPTGPCRRGADLAQPL